MLSVILMVSTLTPIILFIYSKSRNFKMTAPNTADAAIAKRGVADPVESVIDGDRRKRGVSHKQFLPRS